MLGKTAQFINGLTKPFSQDILTKKEYSWDGHSSINVAFKNSSVWVLNYDPEGKKATILQIPDETYLDLPRGFGSWRMGSVFALGQEENPPIGSELLKQSLSKLLGLPVDGFITLNNPEDNRKLDEIILSWHNNPIAMLNFIRKIKTDLTPLEAFILFQDLAKVRSDKIIALDLAQTNITKSKLLPDLSRVLGVDSVNLDLFIRNKMANSKISGEALSVAIYNATSHVGLAQDVARIVTNLGADVIIVSNTENYLQKSQILYTEDSNTATRLAQIFAPWCLKQKCSQSSDPKINSSRANINVILGADYYQKHYQR